ncbi:hypothetical protein C8Q72DRAFT_885699 [Fomitopsis betulina]|nr:hypothetical protein C8Q72DRAFT_885699 [Fomitopsis betulina]
MSFLLLRDGTIYFGLLLIISILDVVIYTVNSFQGFQYLRLAFTTIILSRFFVNLREASQTTILDSVTTLSEWKPSSTLHFSLGVDAYGGTLASVQSGAMTSDIHDNDRDDDSLAIAMEPRVGEEAWGTSTGEVSASTASAVASDLFWVVRLEVG